MRPKVALICAIASCVVASTANADVIYKCRKGAGLVYQDEPCRPGAHHADRLTHANSRGTITVLPSEGEAKPESAIAGNLPVLDMPRLTNADFQVLEERQQLMGKPPIKEQFAQPTAIESRTQTVWAGVKARFGSWFK